MNNYNLQFISNTDLYNHVYETVNAYSFEMDLKKFNKNLIDPIKLTFDSIVYDQSYNDTIENEVLRQLDKTNSNLIGYFHQNIFKYFSNDWIVPKQGYDIQNINEKILVEMKNKHNTMNSSSSAKTYMKMQGKIIEDSETKCYLVEIIAKNSQNIPWIVTIDGEKQKPIENIRRISIDKFYEIVTNDKLAFQKLCTTLPVVIKDVVNDIKTRSKKNTVFAELDNLSPDLLTSIYLLSFKKYEGFNNFKL
ncbi:Eco47II family restriction endonuclease [Tenacibaculum finnmarkense]|uniref:Eco47II family restriction endonuclease n=1 Tax=Tenacibaculum finnmarkense TaxID=2781243 RepID=UPI001EFADF39|nr:Eco47II family restriction endonuclease [Tenacibaculum finnmarkense]MCG8207881.1 Eco47II family restriction endonuclease [Tenacibaculum finnmarkense genomovar finnmarkense]MCG8723949.1 Eco47II family restriction endonuclease [Tenacibaculum finnmarkense]MCG8742268.1 Eco47II family restriction endonuclease [Tenacibaculum finnmarkense]MCG8765673.1 Eco47II family restriction endonuclease [Tenacibaculum finnmarkense]MCG8778594.1 Eco47II family restriction endonuclease [Tenacibaculum finnmarkense